MIINRLEAKNKNTFLRLGDTPVPAGSEHMGPFVLVSEGDPTGVP